MKSNKKFIIILGSFLLLIVSASCFLNSSNDKINSSEKNNTKILEEEDFYPIEMTPKCSIKADWYRFWSWDQTGNVGKDIIIDDLDNIYIMGDAEDPNTGEYVIAIVKYDSEGRHQWNSTWGRNDGYVEGKAIARDTEGNFFVVGSFYNTSTSDFDILLVKFNSFGEYQWYKIWKSTYLEFGNGIAIDLNNNIYIAGEIWNDGSPYTPGNNITIISFDSTGSHRWNRTIGYNDEDDGAFAVTIDSSNFIYIAGYTESYETCGGISDIIVFKYNSEGVQIWNSTYGSDDSDGSYGIAVDSDSNVFVAGQFANQHTDPQPVVFKLNSTGDYKWNYTWTALSGRAGGEGRDIAIGAENDVYFTGFFDTLTTVGGRDYDVLVAKFNNTGTMLWNRTWDDGSIDEKGNGIALDSKENIYIGGCERKQPNDWFLTLKIVQTPGSFTLSSDADNPDIDGSFKLTWSISDGAENYSIYEHSSYIYEVNDTINKIDEGLNALNYDFTDKQNGTYYYKIVSFNRWGNESSNCIAVIVSRAPPGAFIVVSDAGDPDLDGNFNLGWSHSQYAENYSLYQNDTYIYDVDDSIKIDDGLTNDSYYFRNYANGTYYFKLVAFNINGNTSSICIKVNVTRFPPQGFTLDSDALDPDRDGCFNLNWTESLYAENYSIYQHDGNIFEINDSIKIADGVTSLTHHVSALSDGMWYFRVVAFNINGNSTSNCIQVEVYNQPPGPLEFYSNATNPETNGVVLMWWNVSLDAVNYTLYLDTVPITDFTKKLFNVTIIGQYSRVWTFLSNGDYYVRIVAFNRNGNYTALTEIWVHVRLAPKPLTLTSDADIPSDSDGNFKLNWSISLEFSYFNVDITNYSIYYSTQTFTFDDIGNIAGIICLKSNITFENYNCTGYSDGTHYFMVVAYNPYGNCSSNCLGLTISHPRILLPGDDDDGGNGGTDNNIILFVVIGSIISGAIVAPSIVIINHKKKANRLKKLDKIVKSLEKPKEGQNPPQNSVNS